MICFGKQPIAVDQTQPQSAILHTAPSVSVVVPPTMNSSAASTCEHGMAPTLRVMGWPHDLEVRHRVTAAVTTKT